MEKNTIMNKPQKITLCIAVGAAIIASGLVFAVAKSAEKARLPPIEFREGCISASYTYRQTIVIFPRNRPCRNESPNYWDKNLHGVEQSKTQYRAPNVSDIPQVPD